MDQRTIAESLSGLAIGEVRFFDSIGSTNDEALAWAARGAQDLSIVFADEQTAGRGRLDRKWFTPAASAIAMSLILRPSSRSGLSRTVGLAALSVTDSLLGQGLEPRIKWPNDILLGGKKVAGILTETVWSGGQVDALVIGIGMNVTRESLPPAKELHFPATTLEDELGRAPEREGLVRDIVRALIARRPSIESPDFLREWEERLAFRGRQVEVTADAGNAMHGEQIGLNADGSLKLKNDNGAEISVHIGDVSLRPAP